MIYVLIFVLAVQKTLTVTRGIYCGGYLYYPEPDCGGMPFYSEEYSRSKAYVEACNYNVNNEKLHTFSSIDANGHAKPVKNTKVIFLIILMRMMIHHIIITKTIQLMKF